MIHSHVINPQAKTNLNPMLLSADRVAVVDEIMQARTPGLYNLSLIRNAELSMKHCRLILKHTDMLALVLANRPYNSTSFDYVPVVLDTIMARKYKIGRYVTELELRADVYNKFQAQPKATEMLLFYIYSEEARLQGHSGVQIKSFSCNYEEVKRIYGSKFDYVPSHCLIAPVE